MTASARAPSPPTIVLASASPRRRALLEAAGLEFEILPAGVDETLPEGLAPVEAATLVAERKARAAAARLGRGPAWVLGADTLVALERPPTERAWTFLGKPGSAAEARGMLAALSGSRHVVVTGLCVVRVPDGSSACDAESTWVTMRVLGAHEIDEYVASGEWRDKAGGYAIQESADRFVVRLEGGGFDNVVGLPVERALSLLRSSGAALREGSSLRE